MTISINKIFKEIVKEIKIIKLANYFINIKTEKIFLRNSTADEKII